MQPSLALLRLHKSVERKLIYSFMNEHTSNIVIATLDFAGRIIWPAVLLIVIFKV